jgi:hypothetical protein
MLNATSAILRPPYALVDQPPAFDARLMDADEVHPPAKPFTVTEQYPKPILSLPLWNSPWNFLNMYVRTANAALIERHQKLSRVQKSSRKPLAT